MDREDKTILVYGATGNQGGATARRLLADGWRVRALTRSAASEAAAALAAAGAEIVTGDMDDRASLKAATAGVHGVFSVQPTLGSVGTSPDFTVGDETRWGCNVADAAADAGVTHFIYTSLGGAERNTGVANIESKWEIEQHIAKLGLPATVLRPVSFMEMCASPFFLRNGALTLAIEPDVPWQLLAVHDVGVFAGLAFAEPEVYLGLDLELAGDSLTPPQLAAAMQRATGRPVPYVQLPIAAIRQFSEDAAKCFEWLNAEGYQADIPALRAIYPDLLGFDAWLAGGGTKRIEAALTD